MRGDGVHHIVIAHLTYCRRRTQRGKPQHGMNVWSCLRTQVATSCLSQTRYAPVTPYWGVSAEHDAVAADICYKGTPPLHERAWAERINFTVRAFSTTWTSARALLDRGIPFTLTTVGPDWSHLQAVVGYDPATQALSIRDKHSNTTGGRLPRRSSTLRWNRHANRPRVLYSTSQAG